MSMASERILFIIHSVEGCDCYLLEAHDYSNELIEALEKMIEDQSSSKRFYYNQQITGVFYMLQATNEDEFNTEADDTGLQKELIEKIKRSGHELNKCKDIIRFNGTVIKIYKEL